MTERRYSDDELREIFDRASRSSEGERSPGPVSPVEGLTLDQLRRIAEEVGLSAERIEEAAVALDRPDAPAARRRLLGAPIGVARMTALPRPLEDHEWELLLAELRRTFEAQGSTESIGHSRHWKNGRLYASIEPDAEGYRLRMGTTKSSGKAMGFAGFGLVLTALVLIVLGLDPDNLESALTLLGLGGTGLVANVIRLHPWARRREAQMEYIAERARQLLAAGDEAGPDPDRDE